MSFMELEIKNEYRSRIDNIVNDFYFPILEQAKQYNRAVGFFSSTSLSIIAQGLLPFVNNGGIIRLIASPKLSKEDIEAMHKGYAKRKDIVRGAIERELYEPADFRECERLNLLAKLIADQRLDIKLALIGDIGLYHEKMGIFIDDEGEKIAFSGSMNETETGININYETIDVFASWKSEDEKKRVENKYLAFETIWNNQDSEIDTLDFPEINEIILQKYLQTDKGYSEFDKSNFEFEDRGNITSSIKEVINLGIPSWVRLHEYQLEAITKWKENGYRGIFDMATGTGKTFTALGGICQLSSELNTKLAIFIVCPYIHLVGQWEEDVIRWGMNPIIAHSQSNIKDWKNKLLMAYRLFKNSGKMFVCITTNDTYGSDDIQTIIKNVKPKNNVLLVVDEAHNFGAEKLSLLLDQNIKYRLALSATIERYMDRLGTKRIFDFFGERCIQYTLEKAIKEGYLVEYEYHPIYVFLTARELQEYRKLTKQIKQCIIFKNETRILNEAGKMLQFKRSRLLAGAENKVEILLSLLQKYKHDKYMLIYCGATSFYDDKKENEVRQIEYITQMMEQELGMRVHKFTSEENMKQRNLIKECFADGTYQAITAIRCLDEGVNIPDIRTAFILASSRNPKEFIQRRGRLLRKAKEKERAVIFDFVTLPRPFDKIAYGDYEEDKTIILGELARIYEFGRLAVNPIESDNVMDEIQEVYGEYIDIVEEMKRMEDVYEQY